MFNQYFIYIPADVTTSKSSSESLPFCPSSESLLDTSKGAVDESSTETNENPVDEVGKGDGQKERETQHTKPDWLEFLIKNFKTEIVMECSSRTVRAVLQNEVIKVSFFCLNHMDVIVILNI